MNNGTQAQLLAWPTPGAENLPIPPPSDPASPAPHVFWRLWPGGAGVTNLVLMRWLGSPNSVYQVVWSHDLNTWWPAEPAPTDLGEGLYQWSQALAPGRCFYKVRLH